MASERGPSLVEQPRQASADDLSPASGKTLSFEGGRLDGIIAEARDWLVAKQHVGGHLVFELEADATIPAEYIFLNHYLGTIDEATEAKLAAYLRATQGSHGGWPLYHGGDFNISASVKAYYALKLTGEDVEAPHMTWARKAILDHGGAARANVFTRISLALFGQLPWRGVPVMRVEAMLLPKWAPFHIEKISYWSRTVMVPLLILATLKPRARNPRGVDIAELFITPPEEERNYFINPSGKWLGALLLGLDHLAQPLLRFFPKWITKKGIDRALAFITERLNGEDGLGGIFPAMANAMMAFDALGYRHDHPDFVSQRKAIDNLLVLGEDSGFCQPCLSPLWDTCLGLHALLESGLDRNDPAIAKANKWLRDRQILHTKGDWKANCGDLRPGGWAFQFWNNFYPDVDDTAVVLMALNRAGGGENDEAVLRGVEWIIGMQSDNGGWGAFDANNDHDFLQNIPFADHGALLDPPTADVTARCAGMLAQVGYGDDHPTIARAVAYLKREQEENGSWFGRWGNNYVYGTWSVLCALNAVGEDMQAPYIRKAVQWLNSRQRPDGGWGEDCASYWQHRRDEVKTSTPSQTSWAILGLMAAGEVGSNSVLRGIQYLLDAPRQGGKWEEEYFNAVGFPRVFYLRYHGYSAYFPLWTLARYRNLSRNGDIFPRYGV